MSHFSKILEAAADDGITGISLHWEICYECQGDGTVNSLSHDNGLTGSEWGELCDGDPDFPELYHSGAYDVRCIECDGSGKVRTLDEDASSPEAVEYWNDWHRYQYEAAAEREAERRIGA